MTYYLKYRPQTIAELDLESVRTQLEQALKAKDLPHAFLFVGSRGLGKTSAARILAKAINCQEKQKGDFEPCNSCYSCLGITAGNIIDVIEIDGASNRGIDDIRELRERVKLAPASLHYKVYVIDEVHMLTTEAFNALLKTLEEPPDHVLFILATTEAQKVPATIVSRCFMVKFKRPTTVEIERALKRVVKGENLKIEEEMLPLIARSADGSFRDAVKDLEQLAFSGQTIKKVDVERFFNFGSETQLLRLLAKKDLVGALLWVNAALESGHDWRLALKSLLEMLRDNLLAVYGVATETENFGFSEEEIKTLLELLQHAASLLKNAPLPHLPLEVALIDFCQVKSAPAESKPEPQKVESKPEKATPEPTDDKGGVGLASIVAQWQELLKLVKPQNHSVEALLRSAQPRAVNGKRVQIEVFYEFHKGRLESPKCREIIESSLKELFPNSGLLIEFVLGNKNNRPKLAATASEPEEDVLVEMAKEAFGVGGGEAG